MAQFPNAEADVAALANAMIAGYTAHPADFPSMDPLFSCFGVFTDICTYLNWTVNKLLHQDNTL
jgi:hypothetical protein